MTRYFLLISILFLTACNCDHNSCRMDEIFFNRNTSEEEALKPWEKPTEIVSGVKQKEDLRLKRNILTFETQSLSTREIILKKKREEEKKSLEEKAN